jgi:hypothetical protein
MQSDERKMINFIFKANTRVDHVKILRKKMQGTWNTKTQNTHKKLEQNVKFTNVVNSEDEKFKIIFLILIFNIYIFFLKKKKKLKWQIIRRQLNVKNKQTSKMRNTKLKTSKHAT